MVAAGRMMIRGIAKSAWDAYAYGVQSTVAPCFSTSRGDETKANHVSTVDRYEFLSTIAFLLN